MQAPTHALEQDPALVWPVVRVRKQRKSRARGATVTMSVEPHVPIEAARRPGRIRPAMGDTLELALFIAVLAASGLLHLGALAVVW
jgi:hypothetical protein